MDKKLYLAPMEGITGYVYRNALHKYFPGVDKYVTPFISPTQNKLLNHKELEDILPDNNKDIDLIPQILANNAELFINVSRELKNYGYNEVNLNLGCPSGTVVSKKKGSGLLSDLDLLDEFLDKIYNEVHGRMGMDISIKTRIGKDEPDEFNSLQIIFNQYPIKLLTIHPRVQKELYKGKCHLDVFSQAEKESVNPICYNGDLNTVKDFERISGDFKSVNSFMAGRGILKNPAYISELKSSFLNEVSKVGTLGEENEKSDNSNWGNRKNVSEIKKNLRAFHDEIYAGYEEIFSGDRNVLFKMKELWFYMGTGFQNADKALKQIKKAQKKDGYFAAVNSLFSMEYYI